MSTWASADLLLQHEDGDLAVRPIELPADGGALAPAVERSRTDEPRELVLVGRAKQMLDQARTVDDIRSVIDLAEQATLFARQAHLGLEAQNLAATIRFEAEAKAGELLADMAARGERHPRGRTSEVAAGNFTGKTLAELGVERSEAHDWAQVAAVPAELLAAYPADATAHRAEASRAGLLRYAEARRMRDPATDQNLAVPTEPWVKRGELFLLDRHRIYIANSTDPTSLTELMAGEQAALLATDPPYLVDYQGANHPQSWNDRPAAKDTHWDDYTGPDTGVAFYRAFLEAALPHLAPDAAIYQWHAERRRSLVEAAWAACGLLLHQIIIWRKKRGVLGYSQYQWQHEPCAYGWRQGHVPALRPPATATTVWDVDQVGECDGVHPTQKPAELFRRPIAYHTVPGDIVLDPFAGSGTTIMAAEQLGRRAYCLELEPAYAQAAITRWEAATGRKAVRL